MGTGNGTTLPDAAPAGAEFIAHGRRGRPPQPERVYYHVASSDYQLGDDLLSFNEIYNQTGEEPKWKWEGDPVDTDYVALHDNLAEAKDFYEQYGGRLLRVTMPANLSYWGLRGGVNDEGYPYILNRIDKALIIDISGISGFGK